MKSRGTVSRTSSYSSKAAYLGFSTGGDSYILGASPRGPRQPVTRFLCISHPGGDTLPPPCWLPDRRPARAYQTTKCHDSSGLTPHTSPLRLRRPCPPWQRLPLSVSPTSPVWRPLSHRSIHIVILARIYCALQMPNIFVRMTLLKNRGLLDF